MDDILYIEWQFGSIRISFSTNYEQLQSDSWVLTMSIYQGQGHAKTYSDIGWTTVDMWDLLKNDYR